MTILGTPISFVATVKPAESRYFYETVLGLTCLSDDTFALVFEVGQTTLRIQKVESVPQVNHTVLGWEVSDIETSVEKLFSNGVRFERFVQLPQNELGIWHAPSGALVAWFKDPDGNTLSLTQL